MAATIRCPHCAKSIGGPASDAAGTMRVRLGIVLVDRDGAVHGPCPHCKSDVQVTGEGREIAASPVDVVKATRIIPVLRLSRA